MKNNTEDENNRTQTRCYKCNGNNLIRLYYSVINKNDWDTDGRLEPYSFAVCADCEIMLEEERKVLKND